MIATRVQNLELEEKNIEVKYNCIDVKLNIPNHIKHNWWMQAACCASLLQFKVVAKSAWSVGPLDWTRGSEDFQLS